MNHLKTRQLTELEQDYRWEPLVGDFVAIPGSYNFWRLILTIDIKQNRTTTLSSEGVIHTISIAHLKRYYRLLS